VLLLFPVTNFRNAIFRRLFTRNVKSGIAQGQAETILLIKEIPSLTAMPYTSFSRLKKKYGYASDESQDAERRL